MKITRCALTGLLVFFATWLVAGCKVAPPPLESRHRNILAPCPLETSPFPSYDEKYGPPDWWCNGNKSDPVRYPIFQLSQDYPTTLYERYIKTDCPVTECGWKTVDYKVNQKGYLKEVIKYALEGNLEVDWVVQRNETRRWYHAPYMHLDIVDPKNPSIILEKVAREFTHGLTMERTGCVAELVYDKIDNACKYPQDDPKTNFQSWAVSFYNDRGSSFIGKVWEEVKKRSVGSSTPISFPTDGFPPDSVAVKLLFTEAPVSEVPYLDGSPSWLADTASFPSALEDNRLRLKEAENKRSPGGVACESDFEACLHRLRLLQIDIAIRDNSSPVGWIFATFTYDNKAGSFIDYKFPEMTPSDKKLEMSAWLKIWPLGIMFGNDVGVAKGDALKETQLDPDLQIQQHYGCGSDSDRMRRRLNGPVDNPASSCISCHAFAETPTTLNIGGIQYGDLKCRDQGDISKWFRNIDPRDPKNRTFTPSTSVNKMLTLDYSLQLREGIRRYCVESYGDEKGPNNCNLAFEPGATLNVVTKSGTEQFTVR